MKVSHARMSTEQTEKKRTTLSLPHEVVDEIDEYAEETHVNTRSKAVELIARAQLEEDEEDGGGDEDDATEEDHRSTASGRSASAVTILGVLALALGPTFLSTGYTGLGVVASSIGATYALLWATAYDLVLARKYDDVRAELGEAGGVVGFFRVMWAKWEGTHHVEDPNTPVERAARLELYAPVLSGVGVLVSSPVLVALYLLDYGPARVIDLLGVSGALWYLTLVVGLVYIIGLVIGISSIATIAIATAREPKPTPADEDDEVLAGK